MRYVWYTLLVLFVLCALVLSDDIGTNQMFIIQKTHGSYVLRFGARADSQLNMVINGLKERGVSSDSLWFLWSWTNFDTTGGALTVATDTLINMTFAMRTVYDGIEMIPAE